MTNKQKKKIQIIYEKSSKRRECGGDKRNPVLNTVSHHRDVAPRNRASVIIIIIAMNYTAARGDDTAVATIFGWCCIWSRLSYTCQKRVFYIRRPTLYSDTKNVILSASRYCNMSVAYIIIHIIAITLTIFLSRYISAPLSYCRHFYPRSRQVPEHQMHSNRRVRVFSHYFIVVRFFFSHILHTRPGTSLQSCGLLQNFKK